MTDFKIADTVYYFQHVEDGTPLEEDDLIIASENFEYLDEYTLQNCILGKSKNEVIDAMIAHLTKLREGF